MIWDITVTCGYNIIYPFLDSTALSRRKADFPTKNSPVQWGFDEFPQPRKQLGAERGSYQLPGRHCTQALRPGFDDGRGGVTWVTWVTFQPWWFSIAKCQMISEYFDGKSSIFCCKDVRFRMKSTQWPFLLITVDYLMAITWLRQFVEKTCVYLRKLNKTMNMSILFTGQ